MAQHNNYSETDFVQNILLQQAGVTIGRTPANNEHWSENQFFAILDIYRDFSNTGRLPPAWLDMAQRLMEWQGDPNNTDPGADAHNNLVAAVHTCLDVNAPRPDLSASAAAVAVAYAVVMQEDGARGMWSTEQWWHDTDAESLCGRFRDMVRPRAVVDAIHAPPAPGPPAGGQAAGHYYPPPTPDRGAPHHQPGPGPRQGMADWGPYPYYDNGLGPRHPLGQLHQGAQPATRNTLWSLGMVLAQLPNWPAENTNPKATAVRKALTRYAHACANAPHLRAHPDAQPDPSSCGPDLFPFLHDLQQEAEEALLADAFPGTRGKYWGRQQAVTSLMPYSGMNSAYKHLAQSNQPRPRATPSRQPSDPHHRVGGGATPNPCRRCGQQWHPGHKCSGGGRGGTREPPIPYPGKGSGRF